MHSEHFYIKKEDCDKINKAKQEGRRVIAVGTTSCRVLETIANKENGMVEPQEGDTQIFIYFFKVNCFSISYAVVIKFKHRNCIITFPLISSACYKIHFIFPHINGIMTAAASIASSHICKKYPSRSPVIPPKFL